MIFFDRLELNSYEGASCGPFGGQSTFTINNNKPLYIVYSHAKETRPRPLCTIPFARDRDFVDRKTLLDQVGQACSKQAARAALVGLGGVGKSQLAIEYCYRTSETAIQRKADLWVFWIHAQTRARIEEGFKRVAETIKLPGREQPKADIL